MAALLDSVEYSLLLDWQPQQQQQEQEQRQAHKEPQDGAGAVSSRIASRINGGSTHCSPGTSTSTSELAKAVAAVLALPEYVVVRQNKKSKKKVVESDLRPSLVELATCTSLPPALAGIAAPGSAALRFRTACAFGNPLVTPAVLLGMLNSVGTISSSSGNGSATTSRRDGNGQATGEDTSSGAGPWSLRHIHRSDMTLRPPAAPKVDQQRLRSLLRQEGHLAAAKVFAGRGAWAGGLEARVEDYEHKD